MTWAVIYHHSYKGHSGWKDGKGFCLGNFFAKNQLYSYFPGANAQEKNWIFEGFYLHNILIIALVEDHIWILIWQLPDKGLQEYYPTASSFQGLLSPFISSIITAVNHLHKIWKLLNFTLLLKWKFQLQLTGGERRNWGIPCWAWPIEENQSLNREKRITLPLPTSKWIEIMICLWIWLLSPHLFSVPFSFSFISNIFLSLHTPPPQPKKKPNNDLHPFYHSSFLSHYFLSPPTFLSLLNSSFCLTNLYTFTH